MLFYSMTIQKVQSFIGGDDITPGEYANFMVEIVENLIVKVERQLPKNPEKSEGSRIEGNKIKEWKKYAFHYF